MIEGELMDDYVMIIRINGIHCVGCLNRIKQAAMSKDAETVDINLENHIAKIYFKGEQSDSEAINQAIIDAGYDIELLTLAKESELNI